MSCPNDGNLWVPSTSGALLYRESQKDHNVDNLAYARSRLEHLETRTFIWRGCGGTALGMYCRERIQNMRTLDTLNPQHIAAVAAECLKTTASGRHPKAS